MHFINTLEHEDRIKHNYQNWHKFLNTMIIIFNIFMIYDFIIIIHLHAKNVLKMHFELISKKHSPNVD